jgi:predicted nucleotidyltransferase
MGDMPAGGARALRERLTACLQARPEILDAYLFGSHARGAAQPHSDVDVAVYLDPARGPDPTFGYAAELAADLMKTVGHDAVDVSILNRASPLLYARVLRDGVRLLTRDLGATTVREGRAWSRYCDFVPQLRKIDAGGVARIERGSFGR